MATSRSPYEDTKVPVHKTREDINALLRRVGAVGTAWVEGPHPERPGEYLIALRFIRPEKIDGQTVNLGVRIMVPVPAPQARSDRERQKEQDQLLRQRHRALYYYLKSQVEAVEFGLVQFTEAFLPHLETPTGQTVYQVIGPQYLQGVRSGDMQPLALLPGV